MKRILLLSDLWGTQDRDWVSRYTFVLEKNFQVQYHDGRELENVSMTESSKEKVQKNLYHDKDHDMYIEPEIGLDICT